MAKPDAAILVRVAYFVIPKATLDRRRWRLQFLCSLLQKSGAQEARKGYPLRGLRAGSLCVIKRGGLLKLGGFKTMLF